MSHSLIPPEINSALMYSGAGSGPLLEAAAAWDGLAGDLEATATQYQTAITNLTTGPWLGPSSAQMASAAAPYVAWLQGTAATAAQTGAQAKVAAAAYQTAYASMVPPPVITANRAELTTLVANNFLGQNTGAIANNEADYLSMWIQDALGMDTYQQTSQQAAALPAQAAAPQVASGAVASTAASTASSSGDATSIIGSLLGDFAQLFGVSSDTPTALGSADLLTYLSTLTTGIAANPTAALLPVQATYYMGMLGSTPARMFMSSGSSAGGAASTGTLANMSDSLMGNVGKLVDSKAAAVLGGVGGQLSKWGSGIQASLASATHAGGLSVPHSWHTGVPGADMGRAAPSLPATSVAAPSLMHGLPSSPFSQGLMGALAGRGVSTVGSRVAAKVMPRSPAGG
ncbi:MAG: PPE family protein [Mycobacterium sp.]|uniref:PPE family protein n=2 Tax=Mycobacterium sp. TaxID=1785 RepID=UPI003C9A7A51